ncbi:MAG: protocatechuate 3,4-dioxygenase subunit alpha [Beijerinckiaceae bacterium]|jgi:protocatechuate 3,4-dioxygenase, alpha subunit|nr:protocatechuate 3,4-dioxygenase subunit alpha [Beijerinckiaceae bacterium]MDO9443359.1 protocatechuate 3,4-dioxygenase subunit alpha [Beijerinckiaceae bacterium]
MSGITPSQTVGPYFAYCLTPSRYPLHEIFSTDLTVPGVEGERITLTGRVFDGNGDGISDAMVEIWQADAKGGFDHGSLSNTKSNSGFKGFGRAETTADGTYSFTTVKPGRVPGPDGKLQAPHLAVTVFSRGMLTHLFTRFYFDDEASNAEDPILNLVPQDRRATIIAKSVKGQGKAYYLDIRIQGGDETVFFEA